MKIAKDINSVHVMFEKKTDITEITAKKCGLGHNHAALRPVKKVARLRADPTTDCTLRHTQSLLICLLGL